MLFRRTNVTDKSLQVRSCLYDKTLFNKFVGKASFSASFQRWEDRLKEASLTLEAAVLMPIVILAVCAFCWLMIVFRVQISVQSAMWEVADELSGYAYLYEQVRNLGKKEADYVRLKDTGVERWLVGGITAEYIESELVNRIGKDSSVWDIIDGGITGIEADSMLGIPDADGVIDLVVIYKVKNPFLPIPAGGLKLIQRCYIKAWTGFDIRDEELPIELVYVAETGNVYHPYSDCSYLNLSIKIATCHLGIVMLGNKEYTPCEVCIGKGAAVITNVVVYVTETGERYHKDISCRTLKRTVYEMPLDEALQKYRKCSRCEKREKNEGATGSSGGSGFSNWGSK